MACMVVLTVLFWHSADIYFQKNIKKGEAFYLFVSTLNDQIDLLKTNISDNRAENSTVDRDQITERINEFLVSGRLTHIREEVEVDEDFTHSFGVSVDDWLLALGTFNVQLKTNNPTAHKTIRKLNTELKNTKEGILQYCESLSIYNLGATLSFYIVLLIELVLIMRYFKARYQNKIKQATTYSHTLAKGALHDNFLPVSGDDIGQLSQHLNQINSILNNSKKSIDDLHQGNFQVVNSIDESENAIMNSICELAEHLQKTNGQEEQRNWMNVGIAHFGALLNDRNAEISAFGDKIISELVKYIGANQGAIFSLKKLNEENFLELLSTYAWGKKRFADNKIDINSGNLIAQSVKEGELIYLKEIPDNFINITSGLGNANPNVIAIIPLVANHETLGVIELASFKEFEPHHLNFISKVCANIASTFSSIAHTERTRQLLEGSQQMTEQLRAQEEELRQNAEELEASRENLHRELETAKIEMSLQVETIESEKLKNIAILEGCVDGVVIFKNDGLVEFFNNSSEEIWGISRQEILGQQITKLLPIKIIEEDNTSKIYYVGDGQFKQIDVRTEITAFNQYGEELSLLITASKGEVKGVQTFAFFVQTITVELF